MNLTPKEDFFVLEKEIKKTHFLVLCLVLMVLFFYWFWFSYFKSNVLSGASEAWGQFGDFIGGVFNPLVAYLALYWLTRSIRLQREELLEARKALQETSESQAKQVKYAQVHVRVAVLTALIDSNVIEIQTKRMYLQFIFDQDSMKKSNAGRLIDGSYKDGVEMDDHIRGANEYISQKIIENAEMKTELRSLLIKYR
jgi:hypothetical protein